MGSRSGGVGTNGEEGFNVGSVHHATSILICQKPRNSIAIPLNHQTGVPVLPTVPPSFTTASSGLSSWPPPGGLVAGYLGFLQAHGWGKPVWKESGQALLVRCTMAYSQHLGFGMQEIGRESCRERVGRNV